MALLIFQYRFFAYGDFLGRTGATVINLRCTGNFSKSPNLFFYGSIERGGYSSRGETVNKVCKASDVLVSIQCWSLSLYLSLLPFRGLKRGRGEFSASKRSKLECQHEFSWTEKWLFKQHCTISLLWVCGEEGSRSLCIVETDLPGVKCEIQNILLVYACLSIYVCSCGNVTANSDDHHSGQVHI